MSIRRRTRCSRGGRAGRGEAMPRSGMATARLEELQASVPGHRFPWNRGLQFLQGADTIIRPSLERARVPPSPTARAEPRASLSA